MNVLRPLPEGLVYQASIRHGVVSTAQLRRAGIDHAAQRRRIAAGLLEQELPGAIVVAALRDRFTRLAALQRVRPVIVAERRTAAGVWRFDGFRDGVRDGVRDGFRDGEWCDLVVPPRTQIRITGAPPIRRAHLPRRAITGHDALTVTTPTWTIGELGAAERVDPDLVELALESALRDGYTTEARLHAVVQARPAPIWRGTGVLAEALGRRVAGAPATGSYAETRFLQCIVRPLGLPDPQRQVPIPVRERARRGAKPYVADFVFAREGGSLIVEIDGLTTHGTPTALDHDLLRDEYLHAQGHRVKRFAAWRIERDRQRVGESLLRELALMAQRPVP